LRVDRDHDHACRHQNSAHSGREQNTPGRKHSRGKRYGKDIEITDLSDQSLDKPCNPRRADGSNDPQFRPMSTQRIDRLGLLSDKKAARLQHNRCRLLLGLFDGDKAHGLVVSLPR
tara:strand:- start:15151 stop:15498 length:348 start_codon:yes stop_codon:yes gene_type:complete